MSTESEFYVPAEEILCELGRLQILHSQLDHTLRLAIKRMLGISVDDPGYWNETRGMAAALRERAQNLIAETYPDEQDTADILNRVVDDAEEATELRNRALHSVWIKTPSQEPVLHDRDNTLNAHVNFKPPTIENLASLCERIKQIQRVLNHLARKLLRRRRPAKNIDMTPNLSFNRTPLGGAARLGGRRLPWFGRPLLQIRLTVR